MQPTASRAALLQECSWPFDPSRIAEFETSEAAEYGTSFHEALAHRILNEPYEADRTLRAHVEASYEVLHKWLTLNGYLSSGDTVLVERSLALRFGEHADSARAIAPTGEGNHIYPDLQSNEIAGTADLIIVPADKTKPILVLDHKTGIWGDFSSPKSLPQLQVLGAAAAFTYGSGEIQLVQSAILHTPKDGVPVVLASGPEVPSVNYRLIAGMGRIGDGSLRPGSWCNHCPVRNQCPAKAFDMMTAGANLLEKATLVGSELVIVGSDSGKLSKDARIGRLHMLQTQFRDFDKRATVEIKAAMESDSGLVPIRPDGKELRLVEKSVELLSKASIIRSMGKERGEAVIKELREAGAVETVTRTELHAK